MSLSSPARPGSGPGTHVAAALVAGALVGAADGWLALGRAGLDPLPEEAREAAVSLAVLLHAPTAALLGLAIAAVAWLLGRRAVRMLGQRLRKPAGVAVALAALAALALLAWLRLRGRELDWRSIDPRGPLLLAAGGLCHGLLLGAQRRVRRLAGPMILGLLPLLLLGAGSVYLRAGAARGAALLRLGGEAALSARLQRVAMAILDRDGDGFPRMLCAGGCDCDDGDPAVSPAAADVPENGLDEDCSGADASAEDAARFARLFAPPEAEPKCRGDASCHRDPAAPPAGPPPKGAGATRRTQPALKSRSERRAERAERRAERRAAKAQRKQERRIAKAQRKQERRIARLRRREERRLLRAAAPQQHRAASGHRETLLAMRGRYEPPALPESQTREGPGTAHRSPNLLLITIDTLRADHLGVYGYPHNTSPRIDAWARGAVVFDQARAAGPATRFSIPAMLTGKHFTEVRRSAAEWPRIDDSELLLAERLQRAGYFTAAFHSVVYLQDRYGFGQGFAHRDFTFFRYARAGAWHTPTADYVTDRVLEFADRGVLRRRPFFLWAYYGDPHAPHQRHEGYTPDGPRGSAAYDSEVAFSDHHVGRLLDGLRERGLLEDTYVILTADHGEGLDRKEDHGSKHHSKNLYDELIRVPLIIAGPGLQPRRVETAVSLIDLVPTVMELIGRREEARDPVLRGESLAPYLRGESPPHRPVFAEKHRAEDAIQKCMVLWPYKVIVVLPYNDYSIYNLAEDPKERRNLVATLPGEERERLIGALRYWSTHVLKPAGDNPRH